MIKRVTVNGRSALAAYINDEFNPVEDQPSATFVKIIFTDDEGGVAFLVPKESSKTVVNGTKVKVGNPYHKLDESGIAIAHAEPTNKKKLSYPKRWKALDEIYNKNDIGSTKMNKEYAYSTVEIKGIDESRRVIKGVASTPTPDRVHDIVDPLGAQFKLPIPLLWMHDKTKPVGHVILADISQKGIPFEAEVAKTDEPGVLKDRLDEAWQSLKLGLVRGASIGFKPIERTALKSGGIHFHKWDWIELSLVTIPMNVEATVTVVRSLDQAALGHEKSIKPGASGSTHKPVKVMTRKEISMAKQTIAEQISAFEATRAAKAARMDELMDKAAEDGETLDDAGKEEYDGLEIDIKSIDDHLVRLRRREETNKSNGTKADGNTQDNGTKSRGGVAIEVKNPNLPKATAFTRYAIALARGRGNLMQSLEISKQWNDTPEVETVLRAAIQAGTTTNANWAAPLVEYNIMASEFIEFLRPMTVIGRIPGLRRVPFNIKMPRQTAASSAGWVGEGLPKPVSKLAFDSLTLRWAKAAGIVVLTEELVRFSNPSAEALVRQDLADTIVQFLDEQFLDPSVAAVTNVSPAAITNGAAHSGASGSTADDLRADVLAMITSYRNAKIPPTGVVIIMDPVQVAGIAMMINALGQPEFPGMTINGGNLMGMEVIPSESGPSGQITFIKPSEVLLADDGGITLDVSREASIQMDSTPSSGEQTLVSLWQSNMVALRAERFINWARRRTEAVYYITGADYGAVASA